MFEGIQNQAPLVVPSQRLQITMLFANTTLDKKNSLASVITTGQAKYCQMTVVVRLEFCLDH